MIPQPHEARMMQYGYQQIKSDAQAAQLIRRELKGLRAEQQRRFPVWGCDFDWFRRRELTVPFAPSRLCGESLSLRCVRCVVAVNCASLRGERACFSKCPGFLSLPSAVRHRSAAPRP